MKNKVALFLAFSVVVVLSSCFSIPKTYKTFLDVTTPKDQNTTIKFLGEFWLKKWNDTDIYATSNIVLPSGNNSFLFDLSFTFSNQYSSTTYKIENIELRYLFEAGKRYTIKSQYKSQGLFKGYDFSIELYDTTGRKPELLREWKVGQT
jgi:hypothetical protein